MESKKLRDWLDGEGCEGVREGEALKITELFLHKWLQPNSNSLKPERKWIDSGAGKVLGVVQMLQAWLDPGVQMMPHRIDLFLILYLLLWLHPLSEKLFPHAGKIAAGSSRFTSSQSSNSSRRELLTVFRKYSRIEFHWLVLGIMFIPGAERQNLSLWSK